jgi:hypothetical protein
MDHDRTNRNQAQHGYQAQYGFPYQVPYGFPYQVPYGLPYQVPYGLPHQAPYTPPNHELARRKKQESKASVDHDPTNRYQAQYEFPYQVPYGLDNELAVRKKQEIKASRNHQSKMGMRVLRQERALAASKCRRFAMEKAPLHSLKIPKAGTAGKSGVDYGQHQKALNYNYHQIDKSGKIQGVRVGSLSIGLSYDGDWNV